jgi:pantoate--beta-alanine ligase
MHTSDEPRVVTTPEAFRAACDEARVNGARVGLVPTMGALHEGHLALAAEAARRTRFVAVSIFVNPTQFGPGEDYARYPRDLARDTAALRGLAHLVFAPEPGAMYLPGDETRVNVSALRAHLCGPFRPGHFEGVCTVVTKLFALAGPCAAVFGKKDYQQLAILRRVAADLFLPVEIFAHPIVREADGLAKSSRNAYLSPEDRARARCLSRGLRAAVTAFAAGERRAGALKELARGEVERGADRVDYVEIVDPETIQPVPPDQQTCRALLAVACHVGRTRLIDNVVLGEDAL